MEAFSRFGSRIATDMCDNVSDTPLPCPCYASTGKVQWRHLPKEFAPKILEQYVGTYEIAPKINI